MRDRGPHLLSPLPPPPSSTWQRLARFWLDDLPPLHGLLRFAFYGGMFVLALFHWKSPLRALALYEATDPALYRPQGLLGLLGASYLDPQVLRSLVGVTAVAWVLAAIGLLTRPAQVVCAVGVCVLHGLYLGTSAFNHNHFLTMYALVALCFARTDDRWSVDAWLRRRSGGGQAPEQERARGLASTGLARKVVLVLAVGFYFSAGLTKLQSSGLAWADGQTVAYFAQERGERHLLGHLLIDRLWLCSALSILTLCVELASPLALVSRRARSLLILGWCGMHLGIHLTLGPSYWQNILCLALVVDWGAVSGRVRRRPAAPQAPPRRRRDLEPADRFALVTASLLLPLWLVVAAGQLFWWPLTSVYMYSSYYSLTGGTRAGFPLADYESEAGAQGIARALHAGRGSQDAREFLAYRASVRLAGGGETLDLEGTSFVATRKQWALVVLQPVVIEDLTEKPEGHIGFEPDAAPTAATRFCRELVGVIRRRLSEATWAEFDSVELVYPLAEGEVVLGSAPLHDDDVGTREQRLALLDRVVELTSAREAFSPIKDRRLGLEFTRDALAMRDEFADASTEAELLLALSRASNLRRDGHLQVEPVPSGLRSPRPLLQRAPLRFAVDYGTPGDYALFVADVAQAFEFDAPPPAAGDRLLTVDGQAVHDRLEQVRPDLACATEERTWLELAVELSTRRQDHARELGADRVRFGLERAGGARYSVELPYLEPADLAWKGDAVPEVYVEPPWKPQALIWTGWARHKRYRGFRLELRTPSFTLHVREEGHPTLLLDWRSFRDEHLVADTDRLLAVATAEGWLDADVILDLTTSRGGRRGAYLLQRLVSEPFRVTYGDLRISDVIGPFLEERLAGEPDGSWLTEWLTGEVSTALNEGRTYAPAAPFKCRLLPPGSTGLLEPAPTHFRGALVCLLGPLGRSQVDQVAAMVVDNDLGHTIGMATAGTSNTWEWEEVLTFPGTERPLARFMWSIGHTLRPNGEVLEGNPALPRERLPLTRENYGRYHDELVARALAHLGS